MLVEIATSDTEVHQPSDISPMPKGLLATLTAADISDLVTYLAAEMSG